MPDNLALVLAPSPLWRVERTDPALRFSLLNPVDVMNDRAGNRFDIPGAGVLYGATTPEGGFAETLAGFRPRASMVKAFSQLTPEPGRVLPGQVPTAWLTTRRLRTFEVMGALPFVDLGVSSRNGINNTLRVSGSAQRLLAHVSVPLLLRPQSGAVHHST